MLAAPAKAGPPKGRQSQQNADRSVQGNAKNQDEYSTVSERIPFSVCKYNSRKISVMSGESLKPSGPIPEFKGKGSYGCVLGPAIACVPGTEEGDKARALASPHVSKVFFSDDMKLGAKSKDDV